jgi:quercetin dioxygenase-like cupin family protein
MAWIALCGRQKRNPIEPDWEGKMMDATAGHAVIHAGQIEIRFLLEAGPTAGTLTMFEFVVPAQARVPIAHSHEAFDETVYGLSGVLTWTLDDQQVRVGPGDVLFIPRGHVHHFVNLDTQDARQLSAINPGLLGPEYFQEIAAVVNAGGPPNVERIMEVMRRHGLRPALPTK